MAIRSRLIVLRQKLVAAEKRYLIAADGEWSPSTREAETIARLGQTIRRLEAEDVGTAAC